MELILFVAEHQVWCFGAYGTEMHPVPRRTKAWEESLPRQLQGDSTMPVLSALGGSEVAKREGALI